MDSNRNLQDDGELDRLLGQAQWPEPQAEQLARLGEHWKTIARRRERRFRYGVLAAAASLLLAFGLLRWSGFAVRLEMPVADQGTPVQKPVAEEPRDVEPRQPSIAVPTVALSPTVAEEQPKASDPSMTPRDPSLYERVVLMSAAADREPDRPRRQRGRPQPAVRPAEEALEELIVALTEDADAEATEPLARVQKDLGRCERRLWEIVSRESGDRRLGAARSLARIGTQQSLPVLYELANDHAVREAVMPALGRLASVGDLVRLASVEPDAALRRGLLASLLERRTDESIAVYLRFVNDQAMRPDALAAAAGLADPPEELLLACLENPQKSVRLAAAMALARLSSPQVARRLSGLVLDGVGRQEALVALLLSRSEQARGVLNAARQDLYLVASVRAAEQEIHFLNAGGGTLP